MLHKDFTEIIRRVDIAEEVYYPSKQEDGKTVTTYYAHIGEATLQLSPEGERAESSVVVFFANWDDFLRGYFLTAGKANEKLVSGKVQKVRNGTAPMETEKLIESFRNYAPTLYKVLTEPDSPVKALPFARKSPAGFQGWRRHTERPGRPIIRARQRGGKGQANQDLCPHLHGNQHDQPSCRLAQVLTNRLAAHLIIRL